MTALDKTWHPEHFFCAQCGSFFGVEGTDPNRTLTEMCWCVVYLLGSRAYVFAGLSWLRHTKWALLCLLTLRVP